MAADFDVGALVREDVRQLKYKGVESLSSIAAEVGLPESALIKLDANENIYGTHPAVVEAIHAASRGMAHIYPDPVQQATREAIIRHAHPHDGLSLDQVVAGAGSDDVLDVVLRLLLPRAIVISTPTFGMYKFLGQLSGARVIDVPRRAATFDLDIDGIIAAVKAEGATMVFIPSPNNPTGNTIAPAAVRRLCRECHAVILIDEAYAEFAYDTEFSRQSDGEAFGSAIPLLREFKNLVVTRTFSKWAGLAGLRIGYLLGSPELVAPMMAIKQPYNVSILAEAAVCTALRERAQIMTTVAALTQETARLTQALSGFSRWLRPLPSSANFVLCEVLEAAGPLGLTAERAFQHLRKRGILVRYFGSQGGALENYFRVSAGRPEHTDRVVSALRSLELAAASQANQQLADWWQPDAILFDMDGVIADVGLSYREAIVQTADSFGVSVTPADIDAIKAAGDANNDWKVTHRLISQQRRDSPTLAEVTARFEEFYQDGGLWKTEQLLLPATLFETLAHHHQLGIVTGRPRNPDAIRFLETHQIAKFFGDRIVCMEDAPLKPAPEPVLLALSRTAATLNQPVLRAVMIGDTPDDIKAAVGAGVLPLGVLPPNSKSPEVVRQSLLDAGAFCVLSGPEELGAFLTSRFAQGSAQASR
jgi:histidinol-phosphate aminotransferase